MNRFAINGSSLGGAVRGFVLATAAIVCASTVSAVAVRVAQATTTVAAQASVTPDLTYNHTTTQASITGYGGLYPNVIHTHSASTQLLGSTSLVAYVLRSIPSAATINASAELTVVVASYQGTVNVSGTGLVVPIATRVQAAYSAAGGFASVALTAAPVVYRMHFADVFGQANVRGEPSLKVAPFNYFGHTAYIDVVGTGDVTADALCYREAYADVSGQVIALATGTLEQPGFATPYANGVVWLADAYIKTSIGGYMGGTVLVTADAVIRKVATASVLASADLQVTGVQKHGASGAFTALVSVVPVAFATVPAIATGSTNAVLTAQATIFKVGQSVITATAVLIPEAVRHTYGLTEYLGYGNLTAQSTTTVRFAEASSIGSVGLVVSPELTRYASTDLVCGVTVESTATRFLFVYSDAPISFLGTAEVYADTVANPESYDPFERTFTRPVDVVEFARPFIETEFRRAYEAGYDLQATR